MAVHHIHQEGPVIIARPGDYMMPDLMELAGSVAGCEPHPLRPACNIGADQGLVADELEGEADQDRREGGEPRTLQMFQEILRLIAELRPQPPPAAA
jgi:hypothetical protein